MPELSGRPVGRAARVLLSVGATVAGWGVATVCTAPMVWQQLGRNLPSAGAVLVVLEGTALWFAFTFAVCAAVWCALVLPMALFVSARLVLRWRRRMLIGFPLLAFWLVTWRLSLWKDLGHNNGPNHPLDSPLLWEYVVFGMVLSVVTTWVYTRLLRAQEGEQRSCLRAVREKGA